MSEKINIVKKEKNNNISINDKEYTTSVSFAKKPKKIVISLFLVNLISLLYLEITYKTIIFGINMNNYKILFNFIFVIAISSFITIVSRLTNHTKINKTIYFVLTFVITLYFSIAFVFKKVFNTFFCISLFALTDQAAEFSGDAIKEIIRNSGGIVLLLIPIILTLIFQNKISFRKLNNKKTISTSLIFAISVVSIIVSVRIPNENDNSLFYLFSKVNNNAMNIERLGVIPSLYLDIKRAIFPLNEELISENNLSIDINTPQEPQQYEYNTVDIDFDNLIASENNKTIISMHEYFKNDTGTQKNEYTSLFKDKNLIVIMAESLSTIGISAQYTPTLYKLSNSGFVFNNFYTPINLSTIGGEFQDLTGLFANLNDLNTYWRKGTNYFPYGIGTMFNNAGYTVKAYHANSGYFQDRNVYLKNLGFDYFKARYLGLEKLMDCSNWPQSDIDMIDVTTDEWINEDKFFTYYVSVSGHMPYTRSGNAIVSKNWSLVSDMNVSDSAKGYVATTIELDKAVELLINKLEAAGHLSDTVIAIIPDHYPYNLDMDTINELSTYERDSVVEVNHNTLIIWNSEMETKSIDKVSSQLDFLPTIYNLFGLTFDSRLIMGKDILSNATGIAYFSNRSWVTDKGTYLSSSNTFISKEGEDEMDSDYINNVNSIVSNRINMSKLIIEKNYYKKVLP